MVVHGVHAAPCSAKVRKWDNALAAICQSSPQLARRKPSSMEVMPPFHRAQEGCCASCREPEADIKGVEEGAVIRTHENATEIERHNATPAVARGHKAAWAAPNQEPTFKCVAVQWHHILILKNNCELLTRDPTVAVGLLRCASNTPSSCAHEYRKLAVLPGGLSAPEGTKRGAYVGPVGRELAFAKQKALQLHSRLVGQFFHRGVEERREFSNLPLRHLPRSMGSIAGWPSPSLDEDSWAVGRLGHEQQGYHGRSISSHGRRRAYAHTRESANDTRVGRATPVLQSGSNRSCSTSRGSAARWSGDLSMAFPCRFREV